MAELALPKELSEFHDAQFWDGFFRLRGGKVFEWYGEWEELSGLLTTHCDLRPEHEPRILVPGCGNSAMSPAMYDAGFFQITNIDFSRVVIAEMLQKHVRTRQKMRWLYMDMTHMQMEELRELNGVIADPGWPLVHQTSDCFALICPDFADEQFDLVIDKGGLDALMGEEDSKAGRQFLSEVGRVLTKGGRFACITLAQKHVLELLLSKFREGWRLNLYQVPQVSDTPSSLVPFLLVGKKEGSKKMYSVVANFEDPKLAQVPERQGRPLLEVLEKENKFRKLGSRIFGPDHVSEDIFKSLHSGRRIMATLGGEGFSNFVYKTWVLDAKLDSFKPVHGCAVFLVPKGRAHEWLFSSEEGHWQVAESTKASRLILVFLDTKQYPDNLQLIQDDFSPLVRMILPEDCRERNDIPYMTMGDGVANRVVLQEKDSLLTGAMLVEDVEVDEGEKSGNESTARNFFRRLVFRRNPNLIQSEALLIKSERPLSGKGRRATHGRKKSKSAKEGSSAEFKVDHSYLASPYHAGMVAGLALISDKIDTWLSRRDRITMMIVGLGAGLLPMFVHNHLPVHKIQIVELDRGVGELAKRHFGFTEDDRMQLQVGDGIQAVASIAARRAAHEGTGEAEEVNAELRQLKVGTTAWRKKEEEDPRVHMILVDADSENPSTGLSCPPPEFLDKAFLRSARSALVEGGVLVINVVSRIEAPCAAAVASLRELYQQVYELKIDEDINRVLFALPQASAVDSSSSSSLLTAAAQLKRIATDFGPWRNGPNLESLLNDLERLK